MYDAIVSTCIFYFAIIHYSSCINILLCIISFVFVADVRKCIISILSYPDGCQDVGYGDDRGSTMPDI